MASKIDECLAEFKTSFLELEKDMSSQGLSAATMKQLELEIFHLVGELGRSVEANVLAGFDIDQPSLMIDGKKCFRKYRGPEQYEGFLGKMSIDRTIYQANGVGERTVCPLERNAGIKHHNLTPLAAEFVAYTTSMMVPAEVHELCSRWHFMSPSTTVIKQVAGDIGELAETLAPQYHEAIQQQEQVPMGTDCVVVGRDGTMVNTRDDGWRQAEVGTISFYKNRVLVGRTGLADERPRRTTSADVAERLVIGGAGVGFAVDVRKDFDGREREMILTLRRRQRSS